MAAAHEHDAALRLGALQTESLASHKAVGGNEAPTHIITACSEAGYAYILPKNVLETFITIADLRTQISVRRPRW